MDLSEEEVSPEKQAEELHEAEREKSDPKKARTVTTI